jgi:hypothetical protein
MLQTQDGDKAVINTTFLWIQCFQEKKGVEHDRHSGLPITFNSEMAGKVHNLLARDHRMIPNELNFSKKISMICNYQKFT